jgi:hypothetical protein
MSNCNGIIKGISGVPGESESRIELVAGRWLQSKTVPGHHTALTHYGANISSRQEWKLSHSQNAACRRGSVLYKARSISTRSVVAPTPMPRTARINMAFNQQKGALAGGGLGATEA